MAPSEYNHVNSDESLIAWWWKRAHLTAAEKLTAGNRQITSITGALLTPLLGLVFLTGLAMDMYWHVHYVIGFVLIPVVALKVASTGYRAISYYVGRGPYKSAGPPELSLRLLAPIVVISTAAALTTGVALWAQHSRTGTLATLHTDAAVICAGTVGIHALAYTPMALTESFHVLKSLASRMVRIRLVIIAAVLISGIAIAIVTYANGTWPPRDHRGFGDAPQTQSP